LRIFTFRARGAAASQSASKPNVFNLNVQGNVVGKKSSSCSEFRVRQSIFELLYEDDEWIFDTVFSFSEEICVQLSWVCNYDFNRNNTAFDHPERPQA
jgi:hypothetical protein